MKQTLKDAGAARQAAGAPAHARFQLCFL